jgi:hypothetical protein
MAKQRFIAKTIWQIKDLSLQKYGKANIFLYTNMTKQ